MALSGPSTIAETDFSDGVLNVGPPSPPSPPSPVVSLSPNADSAIPHEQPHPALSDDEADDEHSLPFPTALPPHDLAPPSTAATTRATTTPPFTPPAKEQSRPPSQGAAVGLAGGSGATQPLRAQEMLAEIDFPELGDFPPVEYNIFDPALHGDKYKHIEQLLKDTADPSDQYFFKDFTAAVQEEVLLVGSVPVDELNSAEARVREQSVARVAREREVLHDYKARLEEVVKKARARLAAMLSSKMAELRGETTRLRNEEQLQRARIANAFRAAEAQLLHALQLRQGEVSTMYGELVLADGQYGGARGRRWRVDWDRTPQPIQIKLAAMRGVRDKAPAGRYAIVVSLQDRLGGRLLRWSSLRGQEWGAATLPVSHNGRHNTADIKIDQSVFTACPARPDIRPSMTLIFEVYALLGEHSPLDRVLAWGAFPISDPTFNVVSGCFKTPLMRGAVDPRIDRFGSIEKRIATDLNAWFCNLYFEIVRLPRYVSGQREYEVALQFNSGLLGFPARQVDPAADEEALLALPHQDERPLSGIASGKLRKRIATAAPRRLRAAELNGITTCESPSVNDTSLNPLLETHTTEVPGVSYDLHKEAAFDRYHSAAVRMIPRSRLGAPRQLTDQERLDTHTYSVLPPLSSRAPNTAGVKLQYVSRQLLAELGLAQIKSGEFWFSILALLLMFWLRIYGHYFGQWLYLESLRIPVTDYTFLPVSVELNYQGSALLAREEIGVVCLGPIFLIAVMICLTALSALSQWLLGSFSALASRFVCAWGLLTVLDPVLIFVVDLAMQRWQYNDDQSAVGDAFKLFWHFKLTDASGLPGAFLTVFLYVVLMTTAAVVFYIYFLRLHMDGRMMDTFHRLNCADGDFLLPYDTEVSIVELKYITRKAEQWRGPKGERRKIAVYDYVWKEELSAHECTTHVSIHTLHLDGSRDLFRQFLRLPDGAVVEVFGSIASQNIDGRIRINLQRANVDVNRLLTGATAFVNKHMQTTGDLSSGKPSPSNARHSGGDYSLRRQSIMRRGSLHAVESQA